MNAKFAIPVLYALIFSHSSIAKEGLDAEIYSAQLSSVLYSGDLTNPQTPSKDDQKLWLQLEGRAAKAVFNKLKASSQDSVEVNGHTTAEKHREGLRCRSAAKSKDYRCTFQIDLITGQVFGAPIVDLALPEPWHRTIRKDSVDYRVFSAGVADPLPPSFGRSNLAMYMTGKTAKGLFNAIGPDTQLTCDPDDKNLRVRVRANHGVKCVFNVQENTHRCAIGLDLQRVKPTVAMTC